MLLQQRLLNRRQDLVGIVVKACLILHRIGVGLRPVIAVEQVIETDPPGLDIGLEPRADGRSPLARQVEHGLVIIVELDLGQLLAGAFGLGHQAFRRQLELAGLLLAVQGIGTQLIEGDELSGQALMVVGGAGGDLLDLAFDAAGQFGDAAELLTGGGDLLGRGVQLVALALDIADHCFALLADVGHHATDLLGSAGGARRQTAYFVGDHGKAAASLTGTGGLDGCVQSQQVGLAGDGLDHVGNAADFLCPRRKPVNQLAAGVGLSTQLLHAFDGALQFGLAGIAALAHRLRGIQCVAGPLGAVLLGGGDSLGTIGNFADSLQLRLQADGQLLGAEGDLGSRQGVVAGTAREILGQLGEALRRPVGRRGAAGHHTPRGEPGPKRRHHQ